MILCAKNFPQVRVVLRYFDSGYAQSAARSLTALEFNSVWEEADSRFQMGTCVTGCPGQGLQLLKPGAWQQGREGA